MTAPLEISDAAGPGLALVFGFFFGLVLEGGGLGNPHKLSGVFFT